MRAMKKITILFLLISFCGGSAEVIDENTAVVENTSTSTTTTTTVPENCEPEIQNFKIEFDNAKLYFDDILYITNYDKSYVYNQQIMAVARYGNFLENNPLCENYAISNGFMSKKDATNLIYEIENVIANLRTKQWTIKTTVSAFAPYGTLLEGEFGNLKWYASEYISDPFAPYGTLLEGEFGNLKWYASEYISDPFAPYGTLLEGEIGSKKFWISSNPGASRAYPLDAIYVGSVDGEDWFMKPDSSQILLFRGDGPIEITLIFISWLYYNQLLESEIK